MMAHTVITPDSSVKKDDNGASTNEYIYITDVCYTPCLTKNPKSNSEFDVFQSKNQGLAKSGSGLETLIYLSSWPGLETSPMSGVNWSRQA